jgi:hypothetical protein
MSRKYPEVLRVDADRRRILHGKRHNHCYTSLVYRQKVQTDQSEIAAFWSFRTHLPTGRQPAELFAAIVRSGVCDSVIVYDQSGKPAYPIRRRVCIRPEMRTSTREASSTAVLATALLCALGCRSADVRRADEIERSINDKTTAELEALKRNADVEAQELEQQIKQRRDDVVKMIVGAVTGR